MEKQPKSIGVYDNYYKKLLNKNADFSTPAENLVRAIKIDKIFPTEEYNFALDFGCGSGRHSVFLAELGYKVNAVDVSEQAVLATRSRFPEDSNIDCHLIEPNQSLPIDEDSQALIISWETMHWLGSENAFDLYLNQFKRISKNGARFIVTMPQETHYLIYKSVQIGTGSYVCELPERNDTRFYAPNLYTLEHKFKNMNFDTIRMYKYSHARTNDPNQESLSIDMQFSMYAFVLQINK